MRSATQELRLQGLSEGLNLGKVEVVENMLKKDFGWDIISEIANITQEKFNELKQRMKEITSLKVQLGMA